MKLDSLNYSDSLNRALRATVPLQTDTYSPVPHNEVLVLLRGMLLDNRFNIVNTRTFTNGNGNKLVGYYDIEDMDFFSAEELGIRMMIGFKNSYDKSMSFGLAAGGSVMVCENGVVSGDLLSFRRKHTGTILEEVRNKMQEAISSIRTNFQSLLLDIDIMKNYTISNKEKAELLGVMYFEHNMFTPNQLSKIKTQMETSEHFRGDTVWDLYNNVTEALKHSHPITHLEDHIELHKFMGEYTGYLPELESAVPVEETVSDETSSGQ
jgi:hypothetical protein